MAGNAELAKQLDPFARRGSRAVRGGRLARDGRASIEEAAAVALILAGGLLVFEVLRLAFGVPSLGAHPWLLFAVVFGPAFAWFLLGAFLSVGQSVSRGEALSRADQSLHLGDRLRTAAEFLEGSPAPDGMRQAALDETRQRLQETSPDGVRAAPSVAPPRGVGFLMLLLAFLAYTLAIAVAVRQLDESPAPPRTNVEGETVASAPAEPTAAPPTQNEETAEAVPPAETVPPPPAERADDATIGSSEGVPSEELRETEGKTGSGRASEAKSPSDSGAAKGSPTQQSPSVDEQPRKDQKPKKPAKPGNKEAKPRKPEPLDEKSGTTAGLGSSKGSNRNPAVSDWQSKDKVESPEDSELENDEDIEDEEEEQEARGGIQPNMRDRKPPVNRDLRIGFGNRPNPDANGRGGPSEMKKSRGVASLVLGVPIPDRIKGQPNKGKTKVTQERIEPKPEDVENVTASARTPRSSPVGILPHPDLSPWMQQLIRDYFLSQRP